ncbi:MAG: AI-2E family transporter, partial [Flavisolibacter sp.]
ALLLGVIGAILNIIPYLGIFMACILSTLITLTTNSPSTVVWVIVSLIIIHMLDSNILMPRIVGSKVKINALATIVGIITGSALWGIPGTFMAVPIMAVMKVAFEEIDPFRPFAILMGDDVTVTSMSRPVLHKIARSVRRQPVKK